MISDDLGKQLHDKATRGLALTRSEQTQLEAWYELQDQVEARLLTRADTPSASPYSKPKSRPLSSNFRA